MTVYPNVKLVLSPPVSEILMQENMLMFLSISGFSSGCLRSNIFIQIIKANKDI